VPQDFACEAGEWEENEQSAGQDKWPGEMDGTNEEHGEDESFPFFH